MAVTKCVQLKNQGYYDQRKNQRQPSTMTRSGKASREQRKRGERQESYKPNDGRKTRASRRAALTKSSAFYATGKRKSTLILETT